MISEVFQDTAYTKRGNELKGESRKTVIEKIQIGRTKRCIFVTRMGEMGKNWSVRQQKRENKTKCKPK